MTKLTGLPAMFHKIVILFGLSKECHCGILPKTPLIGP